MNKKTRGGEVKYPANPGGCRPAEDPAEYLILNDEAAQIMMD
jgi:hypothetical protein